MSEIFKKIPGTGKFAVEGLQTHTAVGEESEWWRSAVIYQIYPRSWADSNADGFGDLPGITQRLEYLSELGVDAVWYSPFYVSPQADGGYDVADHRDIDPLFGSLSDFDAMLAEAHRLDLRVMIDLVPNHTSDEHVWFKEALSAKPGSAERDRYIFRDGRGENGELAPNNWQSMFGGPAWTRINSSDGTAEQWYLHLFDVKQPDLNWRSDEVRNEVYSVIEFWLDRGVDGLRVDVANALFKEQDLPDWFPQLSPDTNGPNLHLASPMWDQDEVHPVYRQWRELAQRYEGDRAFVAEAWVSPLERLARYVRPDEMHQAFNFAFLLCPWSAPELKSVITQSLEVNDSAGAPTTWVLSNHDVIRHASRFGYPPGTELPNGIGQDDPQPDMQLGLRRARAATLLMLALPGSSYLYQGEELGLPEHTLLADGARKDPTWLRSAHKERGRDGCRVPFPWAADQPCFGFSDADNGWLAQPDFYRHYALDAQRGVEGSTFEMYRSALALRKQYHLGTGGMSWIVGLADGVIGFVNGLVAVLANTNSEARSIELAANFARSRSTVPGHDVVIASSAVTDAETLIVPGDSTIWLKM